jgi:hypothetical protein
MQKLCFLAAFIIYLETDELIIREDCAAMIGGEIDVVLFHIL